MKPIIWRKVAVYTKQEFSYFFVHGASSYGKARMNAAGSAPNTITSAMYYSSREYEKAV